jgi:hypothetical protein
MIAGTIGRCFGCAVLWERAGRTDAAVGYDQTSGDWGRGTHREHAASLFVSLAVALLSLRAQFPSGHVAEWLKAAVC